MLKPCVFASEVTFMSGSVFMTRFVVFKYYLIILEVFFFCLLWLFTMNISYKLAYHLESSA